jgi:hypothetical protein
MLVPLKLKIAAPFVEEMGTKLCGVTVTVISKKPSWWLRKTPPWTGRETRRTALQAVTALGQQVAFEFLANC